MNLTDALTEAMCHAWNATHATGPKDTARPAEFAPETAGVLKLLSSLAHEGVLVVDFRTHEAGEVKRAEHVGWERLGALFELDPNPEDHAEDVADRTLTPVFALVRTDDGSAQ